MKRYFLLVLLFAAVALSQNYEFGWGTGSAGTSASEMRAIVADSNLMTMASGGYRVTTKNGLSMQVDTMFVEMLVTLVDTVYQRIAVLGAGGASVPLTVYGNKSTGYQQQWINDKNKSFGDSSCAITAKGESLYKAKVTLDTDATVALTLVDCLGCIRINNDADAIDYTLPPAMAGLVIMFYDVAGGVITIDPYDGTDTIYLGGSSVGAGYAIDSPGIAGNFICLVALDDTRWVTTGQGGFWTNGGAD